MFSTRFKAVSHKIKKLELAKAKITGLKEVKIDSEQDLFVAQLRSFYFTPEVEGDISLDFVDKPGGPTWGSYTEENYGIEVFSWTKSLEELKMIVETWEKDYQESFIRQTITLSGKVIKMEKTGSFGGKGGVTLISRTECLPCCTKSRLSSSTTLRTIWRSSTSKSRDGWFKKIQACPTSCRKTCQG